jgi:uncharacterized protein YjbI with pentapeptide repeats
MATKRQLQQRWKAPPGAEILEKLNAYFGEPATPFQRRIPARVLELLDGLPLRDEVAGGRDLRGALLGAASDLDLARFDFSHGEVVGLLRCDLRDARFDDVIGEAASFGGSILDGASFRKARLLRARATKVQAQRCVFDGARLSGSSLEGADLAGSSFRDAQCKRVNFSGTNLRGCDFRGAILDESTVIGASIDQTTDLRGASLINATAIHPRDVVPGAVRPVEEWWRAATWDGATRTGVDEAAREADVVDALLEVLRRANTPQAERVREQVNRIRADLPRLGDTWGTALFDAIVAEDRSFVEQALDEAFRQLD